LLDTKNGFSKFVVKKKETISAVIEEKAIKESLALDIAMLVCM
jgi:hypothetical protein